MKKIFINGQAQLRSGWKIALVFLTMAVEFVILTIIAAILFFSVTISSSGSGGGMSPGGFDLSFAQSEWMTIIGGVLQSVCVILAVIFCWKIFDRKPLRDMGLTSIRTGLADLVTGLVFGAVSITAVFIYLVNFGGMKLSGSLAEPHVSWSLFTGAVLFIFVGLSEEILSRGYFMTVMKQTGTRWVPVLVSSILFSVIHAANPNITMLGFTNIFLVGILFAAMFLKTGSLWMPIGYHITWNYFQGNIYGMNVSGMGITGLYSVVTTSDNIMNGGKFGPEGGLAVTLIIILGLLAVWKLDLSRFRNSQTNIYNHP